MIVRRHAGPIEEIRARLVDGMTDPGDLRGWVNCLVRPVPEHLAALGGPTWYARFCAQVLADPALHRIMVEEAMASPSLRAIIDGLDRCLPGLPPEVRAERDQMVRHLIVQVAAERERALAEHAPTPRATWDDAATGLADAVVGMWRAPVTAPAPTGEPRLT